MILGFEVTCMRIQVDLITDNNSSECITDQQGRLKNTTFINISRLLVLYTCILRPSLLLVFSKTVKMFGFSIEVAYPYQVLSVLSYKDVS